MTKEQKLWLVLTILLFVVFMAVGWYFTVAQALKRSIQDSKQTISLELGETKQQVIGDEDVGKKTQETIDKMKDFFGNIKQYLENKQQAEQAILENVKEELKQSSTQ
ncbi:hypothetical protein A3E97_02675 [Candidatus Uhrbacteria bacterium RIFCSPHIGHO2_12_FULL_47_12]|nr:MAG: hypothetical protein A3E97_02675 [Candidatus Uhrbacteria bacterium RIFCSPHIGHO2_12_FULL_47_12]